MHLAAEDFAFADISNGFRPEESASQIVPRKPSECGHTAMSNWLFFPGLKRITKSKLVFRFAKFDRSFRVQSMLDGTVQNENLSTNAVQASALRIGAKTEVNKGESWFDKELHLLRHCCSGFRVLGSETRSNVEPLRECYRAARTNEGVRSELPETEYLLRTSADGKHVVGISCTKRSEMIAQELTDPAWLQPTGSN